MYTVNLKLTLFKHKDLMVLVYSVGEGYSQTAASPTWSKDDKHAWHLVCGLYGPSTAGCSQQCKSVMDSGWGTSGKGLHKQQPCINAGDSVHDLSVKLSPCMCSHSSLVIGITLCAISGEEFCLLQTVTNLAVCHENSKSAVCCLLRLTPWW